MQSVYSTAPDDWAVHMYFFLKFRFPSNSLSLFCSLIPMLIYLFISISFFIFLSFNLSFFFFSFFLFINLLSSFFFFFFLSTWQSVSLSHYGFSFFFSSYLLQWFEGISVDPSHFAWCNHFVLIRNCHCPRLPTSFGHENVTHVACLGQKYPISLQVYNWFEFKVFY